jgi:hypothetical protein
VQNPQNRLSRTGLDERNVAALLMHAVQPSNCCRFFAPLWSYPPYSILARERGIVDLAVACSQCEQLAQKRLGISARLKITDCILTRYENLYST